MSLRTQHEFLFIGRDEGSFVENYVYDLGESSERSGKIFINLEIQNNPAEAEMIGETIFDTVRKTFFADPQKDAYGRFEDALKEVNNALNAIRDDKVSKYIGNLHVLIAAIVDHNLYLTQCGDAEAYLVRRRFCSVVSEGLEDSQSKDFFTNIASGVLEPGDLVLLNSTRLLRYIAKTDLGKIASSHNLISILGELKDFLSTEVLGRIGSIGINVLQESQPLSGKEKGKVIAHLDKDEEFQNAGIQEHKKTTITVTDVGRKVADLFSSAKEKIRSYQGESSRERREAGYWTKEKILVAFLVILIVLVGGIWWLRSRAAEQDKIARYTTILNKVQEDINSAESTATYNPAQAGQILNEAEKEAKDVYNDRFNRNKASELLTKIQNMRDKIDGVVHAQPKVFVDLSQKRANISTIGLLALKDTLYAFEYNTLYPILLDQMQEPVPITIDENETVIMGTAFEDRDSLLFYTKAGKVIEYKDNRVSFMASAENIFHKGVALATYGTKFYILDPEANQIWKYQSRRDKFDSADKYNSEGDLKKGVAMAIDGRVYILNSDGSILKFLSGKKEDLSIKKSPVTALKTPTKIFTRLDMSRLYVLEPSQHRILVYTKDDNGDLTYVSQYVFDDIKELRDFHIDKEGKNMYLLDPTKVYRMGL